MANLLVCGKMVGVGLGGFTLRGWMHTDLLSHNQAEMFQFTHFRCTLCLFVLRYVLSIIKFVRQYIGVGNYPVPGSGPLVVSSPAL